MGPLAAFTAATGTAGGTAVIVSGLLNINGGTVDGGAGGNGGAGNQANFGSGGNGAAGGIGVQVIDDGSLNLTAGTVTTGANGNGGVGRFGGNGGGFNSGAGIDFAGKHPGHRQRHGHRFQRRPGCQCIGWRQLCARWRRRRIRLHRPGRSSSDQAAPRFQNSTLIGGNGGDGGGGRRGLSPKTSVLRVDFGGDGSDALIQERWVYRDTEW